MKNRTRMMRTMTSMLMVAVFALGSESAAYARSGKEDREKNALRKMQLMQQQLSSEKEQLAQEKADLTKKVDDLVSGANKMKQSATAAENKKNALARALETAQRENARLNETLKDALTDTRKKQDELGLKQKEALQMLSQEESRNKSLESTLAQQKNATKSCESKNLKLYELNQKILASYKNKGFFDTLLQDEPFTQIKSVEIANILQEYQDKLDEQKIEKQATTK